MFYSPTTAGFYSKAIHGDRIPKDAVEISDKAYEALLEGQSQGLQIVAGKKGVPELYDPMSDPVLALAAATDAAQAAITSYIAKVTGQFTNGVPAAELASWSEKATAAAAHLAGKPNDLIIAEAGVTGEKPDDLARAIADKAQVYSAIIARVTGLRRATETAIAAAKTPAEAQAALDTALTRADALVKELGLDPKAATQTQTKPKSTARGQ